MELEINDYEMMHIAEKMRNKFLSGEIPKQGRSVNPEMSGKEKTIWFNVIESILKYASTVDPEYEETIIRVARQTYQKESGEKKLCPDSLDEWRGSDRRLWMSICMDFESSLKELSDKSLKYEQDVLPHDKGLFGRFVDNFLNNMVKQKKLKRQNKHRPNGIS